MGWSDLQGPFQPCFLMTLWLQGTGNQGEGVLEGLGDWWVVESLTGQMHTWGRGGRLWGALWLVQSN